MRVRTWRLLVVLALVAASLLLAVPGVAGAHVKAQYRAEYKKAITNQKLVFNACVARFTNNSQDCAQLALTMAPMIDDPVQRETLLKHEAAALTIHDSLEQSTPLLQKGSDASFDRLFTKTKRWFATSKDRASCRHRLANLESLFSKVLEEGLPKVSMAYLDLAQDPPDLTQEAQDIFDANEPVDIAKAGIGGSIKALLQLL